MPLIRQSGMAQCPGTAKISTHLSGAVTEIYEQEQEKTYCPETT
jgi:hypothetical protein